MSDNNLGNIFSFINDHDFEAKFMPGLLLSISMFLILFYPNFLSWNISLLNSSVIVIGILVFSYVAGFLVHKLGKWIEKFIEKIFQLDLKRIDKIHWIVGRSDAAVLIKKYKLNKTNIASIETWRNQIKLSRKKLKGEDKNLQLTHNKHNKFWRALLTVDIILFATAWTKYGFIFVWSHWIVLIFIIIFVLSLLSMFDHERRELEIIYRVS